jgi:hypothetical protein
MTPVTPPLHEGAELRVYGAQQTDRYIPLPASVDADGTVMTEWQPSAEDLATLLNGGHIRLWLLYTGVKRGEPLTPIAIEAVSQQ